MMGIGVLAIAAVLFLSVPIMASAAGTVVDVNATSVYGKSVNVSGMITPNPGAGQEVSIAVTAPDGANVLSAVVPVSSATGAYNYTAVAGGSSHWINGTYSVSATWGTISQAYTNTTTFAYGAFTTTSTSTSSNSSSSGQATTIYSNTTISSITTVTSVTSVTTIISGTTLTSVTTIVSAITTTVANGSSTALYIGIVAIIIAVVAGAIAAMALRKH